jgi:hypothetical protein
MQELVEGRRDWVFAYLAEGYPAGQLMTPAAKDTG